MIFGAVPVEQAEGAILAHSLPLAKGRMRKGKMLDAADCAALAEAGHARVTVARLEPGDLGEDEAAARLAAALVPDPAAAGLRVGRAATGRVNIHATGPGVLGLDAGAVAAANAVHPMLTLATLPVHARLAPKQMVATVKVISYAVPGAAVEEAAERLAGAMRRHPVVLRDATLIETVIPGAKTPARGEAAIRARLERLGMELAEAVQVPHEAGAIAGAIADARGAIVLVLTASATSDPADTAPEALREAGGVVERFGMPVDPGNLLFTGRLGARPVIGLPGCARSPALNGADWVLERLVCGIAVSDADIAAMGVGGLLKDVPQRGLKRE